MKLWIVNNVQVLWRLDLIKVHLSNIILFPTFQIVTREFCSLSLLDRFIFSMFSSKGLKQLTTSNTRVVQKYQLEKKIKSDNLYT